MDDEFSATGLFGGLHKIIKKIIAVKIVNADTGFYGDGNLHRTLHLLDAFGN